MQRDHWKLNALSYRWRRSGELKHQRSWSEAALFVSAWCPKETEINNTSELLSYPNLPSWKVADSLTSRFLPPGHRSTCDVYVAFSVRNLFGVSRDVSSDSEELCTSVTCRWECKLHEHTNDLRVKRTNENSFALTSTPVTFCPHAFLFRSRA